MLQENWFDSSIIKTSFYDEAHRTVFLKERGMRIGFGGMEKVTRQIGQKRCVVDKGIESGIVNAAGDLTVWGNQPNGEAWTIGIADPNYRSQAFSSFELNNMSVATSGSYEKYVVH
jgi:thiamine biosynthesis lipoprotein